MDRDNEAVGETSGIPINVDDESVASGDNLRSWDVRRIELDELFRNAGIGTPSQFEPALDESGGNAVDKTDISFDGYNFQNALRCADLFSGSSLPDLPWEAPAWRCIFDDKFDPLESLNPTSMLSGPAIPFLPKDGGELKDVLLSEKRQADTLDEKVPIFSLAVGHRRNISWKEKREAGFQRSLMKWTSLTLSWPAEWEVCVALNESESIAQVCEQLSHYFSGKAPATLIKRANNMIFLMELESDVLQDPQLNHSAWLAAFAALTGTNLTTEHMALLQHPTIPTQFPSKVIAPLQAGHKEQVQDYVSEIISCTGPLGSQAKPSTQHRLPNRSG